ncbi:MAG TPA: T9SS type A sorting domain-containing protein, partial [Nitrososphaeraceae archaeon]|nr:T9SS type A sorting domain-containing protein [Nitrososphaeraceae archaeon]
YLLLLFTAFAKAQIVNIPDANFKGVLLNASTTNTIATNSSHFPIVIDANGDDEIQISEALQVYQLRVNNTNISNLTGIEFFTNLANLNCNNNQLTSLTVLATLPNLAALYCDNNQLTALDISGLSTLNQLSCNNNSITAATLNLNNNLIFLDCSNNPLGTLNINTLTNLQVLHCNSNLLSNLNVTNLTNLLTLHCKSNSLSSLNVSTLINLKNLDFSSNTINTIDLSALVNLEYLTCSQNGLTSLNVSASPNLIELNCHFNEIPALNLSTLSNLVKLQIHNNLLTTIDLTGLNVLEFLSCHYNLFTILDISPLSALQHLNYGNVGLGNINVQNQVNLESLFAFFISELPTNMNNLQNLESLGISMSDIDEVDVSNLSSLKGFNSHTNNVLTYVNLKNGNSFTADGINLSNNPNLMFLCINDNDLNNVYDLNNNGVYSVNSYCTFTPGGDFNTITGSITFDANANGCEVTDLPQPNIKIDINDGVNQGSSFTNNSGNYNFYTEAGSFTVAPNMENPTWFTVFPPSATVPFANDNNNTVTQSFCISPNGIHPDLEIVVAPIVPARPGFDATYKIVYKNKGNQMLSQAYGVNFFYNENLMDYVTSSVVPTSINSGGLSWSYANLLPFESRSILVTFSINTPTDITNPVNIGDNLQFTTSILPMAGDENTSDNTYLYSQIVVGAYDPNNIICIEGNVLSPSEIGNYLHYVINFENTGNFEAENIVVKTEINPLQYDISTLRMLNTSHNAYVRIKNNIVEFVFENIALESGGHGNILLKVKSESNLTSGAIVKKRADIYFDYNAPIDTGFENTVFQALSNSSFVKDNSISIYPNPTNSVINIKCENSIKSIELYDVQGRILVTKMVSDNNEVLDISNKSNGIYFLKITSENGIKVEKIIKE